MKASEWRGELRIDIREWRNDKPTKRYQSNPDALEELGQST